MFAPEQVCWIANVCVCSKRDGVYLNLVVHVCFRWNHGGIAFGRYNTIVSGFVVYFIGSVILVVVAAFVMRYFYVERGEARKRIDEPWILVNIIVALLSIWAAD